MVSKEHGIAVVSTGDMIRDNIRRGTAIGQTVEATVQRGELVSDAVVMGMVDGWLHEGGQAEAWIMDGVPRTLAQAHELETATVSANVPLTAAVLIDVDPEVIVHRIEQRRLHPASGRTYHLEFAPPRVDGLDDETGEPLVIRDDDRPDVVRARLVTYHDNLLPILDFYRQRSLLHTIKSPSSPVGYENFVSTVLS